MFQKLTNALSQAVQSFGQKQLSSQNIDECCDKIRLALLDADVARSAAEKLIENVRMRAANEQRMKQTSQSNQIFSIIHESLVETLGSPTPSPLLKLHGTYLICGLQGSGKTTTAAKLANRLVKEQKKNVVLTSLDFQRPAAIDQLETLAKQINVPFIRLDADDKKVSKTITDAALKHHADITIVDTAGRITINNDMMAELKTYHTLLNPTESLFVVDALTGQDAARVALEFDTLIPLSGTILTKVDGDSRGGAALSVKTVTGKPIKFIGLGEKIDQFDEFDAERIASRILDLGDIHALVKKMKETTNEQDASKVAQKIKKGQFDFNDFLSQLVQLKKMGGLSQVMSMLPGVQSIPDNIKSAINDDQFKQIEAMIQSMTAKERHFPALVKQKSRRKRIIKGAGIKTEKEFDQFIKQFEKMQKMLKKFSGNKMQNMMKKFAGMNGQSPNLGNMPFNDQDLFK